MRLPFLILTPACMLLGWSLAIANQPNIGTDLVALSFFGALFAHISVNTLNEYFDFKSGLDLNTQKTKFSGGSGALPENPGMANAVLVVGISTLVATLAIGLFFVWKYGWQLAPLGITGILLIVAYTQWINKHPFLCLVAPGIGFGILMAVGANFVLTGEYSLASLAISFVPFFLVNNLLLLNQYPDIAADREVGRNHFPIAYGITMSNIVYFLFSLLAIATIVITLTMGFIPTISLISLSPMPLALFALSGAIKHREDLGNYPQYLGANVIVTILVPTLLGISIIYG